MALLTKSRALVLGIILLAISSLIFFVLYVNQLVTYVTTPTPEPTIAILKANGKPARVPDVITIGKPFDYETEFTKLVSNGANVRLQLNCQVNGSESIITLGTFYSNVPKGYNKLKRTLVIPSSERALPSDDCQLIFVSDYTFYQVQRDKSERSIVVTSIGKTNHFKLVAR